MSVSTSWVAIHVSGIVALMAGASKAKWLMVRLVTATAHQTTLIKTEMLVPLKHALITTIQPLDLPAVSTPVATCHVAGDVAPIAGAAEE